MHTPPVDSPPRPPAHRAAARAAGVLGLCCTLLLVLVSAAWPPLITFDDDLARTTHRWAVDERGVTQVFRVLTDWVWDPWTMRIVVAAVVVWLVWRRADWWTATWLTATCALGTLLQQFLKAVVGRSRPVWSDPVDTAHYAAFPSGHAMTVMVVCGLLLWLLHRHGTTRALWVTALAVSVVSVVGVGLTRIWLGVHWTTDVIGGWLLGALMVALAVLAQLRWRP
ncbi:membrane-associated phospholipid phosphatase [Streptomyces sp. LBL]|uniref:phosphatase PAP2 family protein n=1 Tax=Streptomyces sp. LBL TaxID=2940562 RepID=UPI0024762BC3|nr:phosphatase PAP2 family protein [Streptomyces sp. LBL]MDH6622962.1 membrane-associated phospholipid phosphatase [Streptomyces sp. LBL]